MLACFPFTLVLASSSDGECLFCNDQIAIMKYFDPVVVSMVMLMEPIVATLQGMAVGVSTLPGWVSRMASFVHS